MDLDSRSGSDWIDDVNSTGSTGIFGIDVAAVQREDEVRTAGQQRNQEEGKDRQQLQLISGQTADREFQTVLQLQPRNNRNVTVTS